MLKTLILDDDVLARKSLSRLVEKREDLTLVEACASGEEALKVVENSEVDLILLDVEMPEMTGFEFLNQLSIQPCVVLITSKEEYAFDAFQYEVFTYLKKPVTIPNFNHAIDRLIERRKAFFQKDEGSSGADHIFLKVDNRLIRVEFKDILYIENVGDYAKVVTNSDKLIVYATMKNLVERLPENNFMRVHRSFIIHLGKIRDIEQNSVVIGDKIIPVSRAAKPELMERLNML